MNQLSRRAREKQMREADIVAAAEKVFIRKGYHEASMDEIAKEAEFAKGTIYQYFTGKEDLYFAVTLRGLKILFEFLTEGERSGADGLDAVRRIGAAYFRFSREHPDLFRLLNYGQYIKAGPEASPNFLENARYGEMLFQRIAVVIERGKTDGSIRRELDTNRTVFSVFLLVTGFYGRLAETGASYAGRFGIGEEEISDFTMDLIRDIMQPR